MIDPEEAKNIKEQLISHIEKSFPEDKKEFAKSKIASMNSSELETFLKQNKLMQSEGPQGEESCVFCLISSGKISSYPLEDTKDFLAVLEINPLSKGHTIIVPKTHISSAEGLGESIKVATKEISKRLKSKLKPKDIKIEPSNIMGHEIINLIPLYEDQENSKERHQATQEELSSLQKMLKKTKKLRKAPKKISIKPDKMILPKRIP